MINPPNSFAGSAQVSVVKLTFLLISGVKRHVNVHFKSHKHRKEAPARADPSDSEARELLLHLEPPLLPPQSSSLSMWLTFSRQWMVSGQFSESAAHSGCDVAAMGFQLQPTFAAEAPKSFPVTSVNERAPPVENSGAQDSHMEASHEL